MATGLIQLFGALATIAATLIGDRLLAKWMAIGKIWLRKYSDQKFQAQVDDQYKKLVDDWEAGKDDRQGPEPKPPRRVS